VRNGVNIAEPLRRATVEVGAFQIHGQPPGQADRHRPLKPANDDIQVC
jgi:hypothetical protein